MKIKFAIASCIAALMLAPTSAVFAEQQDANDLISGVKQGFSIQPEYPEVRQFRAEYNAHPGDVIHDTFNVISHSDTDMYRLDIVPVDYEKPANGDWGIKSNRAQQEQIGVWMEVADEFKEIDIEPNEVIKVPVTLTIPEDLKPGQYWGGIAAASKPIPDGTGRGVSYRVATRIYLQVSPPDVPIYASIANLDLEAISAAKSRKQFFFISLAVSVVLIVLLGAMSVAQKRSA